MRPPDHVIDGGCRLEARQFLGEKPPACVVVCASGASSRSRSSGSLAATSPALGMLRSVRRGHLRKESVSAPSSYARRRRNQPPVEQAAVVLAAIRAVRKQEIRRGTRCFSEMPLRVFHPPAPVTRGLSANPKPSTRAHARPARGSAPGSRRRRSRRLAGRRPDLQAAETLTADSGWGRRPRVPRPTWPQAILSPPRTRRKMRGPLAVVFLRPRSPWCHVYFSPFSTGSPVWAALPPQHGQPVNFLSPASMHTTLPLSVPT